MLKMFFDSPGDTVDSEPDPPHCFNYLKKFLYDIAICTEGPKGGKEEHNYGKSFMKEKNNI